MSKYNVEDLFVPLQYKLRSKLKNNGPPLLGTDVLRDTKRRDLFNIVALNVETKFFSLLKNDFQSFDDKLILLDLVKTSTEDFLTTCYGTNLRISPEIFSRSFHIRFLLENSGLLVKVPFFTLFDSRTQLFRSTFEPVYNNPSNKFLEALLDNLIVVISDSVMQVIINEFSFIYSVRRTLYKSNFLASRSIERFRNNLSWQTRLNQYVLYPKTLYSNQYNIWVIRSKGIYYRTIYANQSDQLFELQQFSLLTITLLELQDFLSSRFDEVLYLIGDRFRYILTETISPFIGLIWRGIIDGLKK